MSASSGDNAPAILTADNLQRLCDFLYRRTGLSYDESKRYFIERRVADHMAVVGTPSFSTYMTLLRVADVEAERLINSFTVNETYFYREVHQFACLSRSLLPEIIKTRNAGDLVRVWSVPCSTGEEPYSIAIWLLENWPLVDAYNIEIVASDIDTRVLADAAFGLYGERSLARLPAELIQRYFEPTEADKRQIIQDLRESVRFTQVNLVDAASMAAQGRFDIILCRNVLIYFDDASRTLAARNLFNALNPGGFICLGHSESMARISDGYTMRRFPDAIVYQRPAG